MRESGWITYYESAYIAPTSKAGRATTILVFPMKSGSPTWARTRDLRINSPSLYQLSYRGREAHDFTRFPPLAANPGPRSVACFVAGKGVSPLVGAFFLEHALDLPPRLEERRVAAR